VPWRIARHSRFFVYSCSSHPSFAVGTSDLVLASGRELICSPRGHVAYTEASHMSTIGTPRRETGKPENDADALDGPHASSCFDVQCGRSRSGEALPNFGPAPSLRRWMTMVDFLMSRQSRTDVTEVRQDSRSLIQ
jgi:hypothetical protein